MTRSVSLVYIFSGWPSQSCGWHSHLSINTDGAAWHGPHVMGEGVGQAWGLHPPPYPDGLWGHGCLTPPVFVPWGHPKQVLSVCLQVVHIKGWDGRHTILDGAKESLWVCGLHKCDSSARSNELLFETRLCCRWLTLKKMHCRWQTLKKIITMTQNQYL